MNEVKVEVKTLVTKYQSDDGKMMFDTKEQCIDYEKRKRGERVICDKCNGKGYISNGWHKVLNELTYQFEDVEYTQTCSKCNGKGYLNKKEVWE